jgi:hypothetical protein
MAAKRKPVEMISADSIVRIFGISKQRVGALKITPVMINGLKCYPLDDIVSRCRPTIMKTMARRSGNTATTDLTTGKVKGQGLKLKLANDQLESGLVDTERFADDYGEKLDAVKSIIAEIPALISERAPNIKPKALAVVQAEIDAALGQSALSLPNL